MTHDPLCPNIPEDWDGKILWPSRCDCVLIAKVRADERQQTIRDCIAAVEVMTIETVGNSAATVDQAIAALRALLEGESNGL
jgi:hypothetical protein